MMNLNERGSLVERFGAATPDYVAHAKLTAAKQAKEHEDNLAGQKSGNKESLVLSSAAATKDAQSAKDAKEEKEQKERVADIFLQSLLDQLGKIDKQIDRTQGEIDALKAEINEIQGEVNELTEMVNALASGELSVEDAMNDPLMAKMLEAWEQEHGPLDPSSPNARDVLTALINAKIDGYEGKLNALGLRVDDLEGKLQHMERERDAIRERILERDELALTQYDEAKSQSVQDANKSYVNAKEIGANSQTAEFVTDARESQDGHSKIEANLLEVKADEDAFADFDLGPVDTLAANTGQLTSEFSVATISPDQIEGVEPSPNPEPTVGI